MNCPTSGPRSCLFSISTFSAWFLYIRDGCHKAQELKSRFWWGLSPGPQPVSQGLERSQLGERSHQLQPLKCSSSLLGPPCIWAWAAPPSSLMDLRPSVRGLLSSLLGIKAASTMRCPSVSPSHFTVQFIHNRFFLPIYHNLLLLGPSWKIKEQSRGRLCQKRERGQEWREGGGHHQGAALHLWSCRKETRVLRH